MPGPAGDSAHHGAMRECPPRAGLCLSKLFPLMSPHGHCKPWHQESRAPLGRLGDGRGDPPTPSPQQWVPTLSQHPPPQRDPAPAPFRVSIWGLSQAGGGLPSLPPPRTSRTKPAACSPSWHPQNMNHRPPLSSCEHGGGGGVGTAFQPPRSEHTGWAGQGRRRRQIPRPCPARPPWASGRVLAQWLESGAWGARCGCFPNSSLILPVPQGH